MWFGGKVKGSVCGDVPHRLASLPVVALISANLVQHCLLRIFSYAISGPYLKGTCPVTCVLGFLRKEKEDGCIMSPPSPSFHLEFSALPFHVRSVAPLLPTAAFVGSIASDKSNTTAIHSQCTALTFGSHGDKGYFQTRSPRAGGVWRHSPTYLRMSWNSL